MKPLKRGNTASTHYETVTIYGTPYKIYNLYTSGLLRKNTILIKIDDSLREITAPSDLLAFKNRVITEKLSLSDLGVFDAIPEKTDYSIKPKDFQDLSESFPPHTPDEIMELHNYLLADHQKSCVYLLRTELKYMATKNLTVKKRIQESKNFKIEMKNTEKTFDITNPEHAKNRQRRIKSITDFYKFTYDQESDSFVNGTMKVKMDYLQEATEVDWFDYLTMIGMEIKQHGVNPPAEPDTPVSDVAETITFEELPSQPEAETETGLATLETVLSIQPDKISDLKNLISKQESIAAANPFVAITDAKTLKLAKKHESALLKASTGTEKIESDASKLLNSIKSTIKSLVTPAAKITREAHEKQKTERLRWENAEEIRIQAERIAQLAKLNQRKTDLFNAGYIFNGELYNIGNLYVTGTQIETSSDEDFLKFIQDGQQAKKDAEAAETETNKLLKEKQDLEKKLAEMQAKLAAMNAPTPEPVAPVSDSVISAPEPVAPPAPEPAIEIVDGLQQTVIQGMEQTKPVEPAAVAPAPVKSNIPYGYEPETEFKPALPGNKPLEAFDKAHKYFIQDVPLTPAFIKVRSYYNLGAYGIAVAINDILTRPADPNGKQKSVMIKELCDIVIKQLE